MRYVRHMPELWVPFAMLAVIGSLSYNFSVTFPLFVERSLGSGDTAYTLLYSVFSVGSVIGAIIIADRKTIALRHIVFGAAAMGVTILLLSAAPSVKAAFPIVILVGMASISFMTSTTAIVQVQADPRMHGRVLALQTVLLVGTTPVGGPILGAVADAWGARAPLVIGGVAALLAAGWGFLQMRRLPTRDHDGAAPARVPEQAELSEDVPA
jgi:MFS family permease